MARRNHAKLPIDPNVRHEFGHFKEAMFRGEVESFAVLVKFKDGSGGIIAEGADSDPNRLRDLQPMLFGLMPKLGLAVAGKVPMTMKVERPKPTLVPPVVDDVPDSTAAGSAELPEPGAPVEGA
jgi:hypothetical protein